MTPIETAICQVIKASGGWPKTGEQRKRCEQALKSVCVHTFSVSWHSVTVDSHTVMQQEYRQWERGL